MPLENLRAMLRMFDCAAAAEWRKLEVQQILRESVIPTRQRDTFERGLNSLVSRSVDDLLAMRLSTFGPELLENLDPDRLMNPASVAEAYWQLYRQPRDAWTFELDLRPYREVW